jgi:hypothetical protein
MVPISYRIANGVGEKVGFRDHNDERHYSNTEYDIIMIIDECWHKYSGRYAKVKAKLLNY